MAFGKVGQKVNAWRSSSTYILITVVYAGFVRKQLDLTVVDIPLQSKILHPPP